MFENAWTIAKRKEDVDSILNDFVFYDNGFDDVIIARKDIAKAIAATPMKYRAKIFEVVDVTIKEIATTIGFHLDYAEPNWRAQNINELNQYQCYEKEIGTINYLMQLPESEYDKLLDEGNILNGDEL